MTTSDDSVRGPHDIGGLEDFGPVPRDHEEHLPWHESVMPMIFALALLGLARTSGEVRSFIEAMSPERYRACHYYERWLMAVEALLDRARHADDVALTESASHAAALGFGDQPQPQPGASQPLEVKTEATLGDATIKCTLHATVDQASLFPAEQKGSTTTRNLTVS
jgi:Nitrile hydratase beta subunit